MAMTHPTTTTAELEENYDIHKIDYKQLLVKYKDAEEANDSFKLQLQDLNSRLNLEHKDKEQLRLELHKARNDMLNNPKGYLISPDADIEEVNLRLKEAYQKLEEEFELREKLNSDLEHTKSMLLAEGKTRMLLESRNTALEQELKNMGSVNAGDGSIHIQLLETKKRLEEEITIRRRMQASKEALESELEDLTKSLFEEANTMVSKEAREKFELLQAKKRLEQELEMAKSKIMLDEKLLTTMKTKFTTLEMKAKKLHRRTGSATSASTSTSPNHPSHISLSQMRSTSSHPNLLTLKDDVETRQRSKSSSLLMHGIMASQSLPSSPVSHAPPDPFALPSPMHQVISALAPIPPNVIAMELLSPLSTSTHLPLGANPSLDLNGGTNPTPCIHPAPNDSSTSKPIPYPTSTSDSNHSSNVNPTDSTLNNPHSIKTTPIQIPTSPTLPSSANPTSISPINPPSTSPINPTTLLPSASHDLTDDTVSEMSHDNNSVVEDDWDMEWLLEETEERKDDDTVLYAEVEGHVDLQGGLSQFVQFLSTAKHDWHGRYMDRVLHDDVAPCLRLHAHEDRAYRKLLEAVWNNKIFLDHLPAPTHEVCAMCGVETTCQWRVRMGSSRDYKNMGDMCRERIVRTCDFYMYLRNLRQGLVKKTLPNIYKEFLRLRLMMHFARLCAG